MMNFKIYIILLLCMLVLPILRSQTEDYGVWTNAGIDGKLGKWDICGNAEFRTKDKLSTVDRWSLKLEASYNFLKPVKAGVGYEFIYFNDTEYSDLQPRQRYILFLQGKQNLGRFSFYLRERFQRTIKNESHRIKENGNYDTYKINPEWYWRNRIKIAYNIKRTAIEPSFSFESFYQLNNPDGNTFNKLRFTLGISYKITKHHEIEIYSLTDTEINVNSPAQKYIAGLEYTYSF